MNDWTQDNRLDWEASQLEDGSWQVWTPDFNGACIGCGATREAALKNTIDSLTATATQLHEERIEKMFLGGSGLLPNCDESTDFVRPTENRPRDMYKPSPKEEKMEMTAETRWEIFLFLKVLALIGAFALGWWVFGAFQEAKAYNRLTGAHATTWDAMWVELRVQDKPK